MNMVPPILPKSSIAANKISRRKAAIGDGEGADAEVGVPYSLGEDVMVITKGKWYHANIIEVSTVEHLDMPTERIPCYQYHVHYPGWSSTNDEWVMAGALMKDTPESHAIAEMENDASIKQKIVARKTAAKPGIDKGMLEFYESETLTDFTLVSSDKKELKAHRVVLAMKCDVFKAMLTHDTKERRTGICEIKDTDYGTLKIVVDSFYGIDVESRVTAVPDKVFRAADKYDLQILRSMVARGLKSTVTVQNAIDRYILGKHHNLKDLCGRVVEFVKDHHAEFLDAGGIKETMDKAPDHYVDFWKLVSAAPNSKKRSHLQMAFE